MQETSLQNAARILRHARQHLAGRLQDQFGTEWKLDITDPDNCAYVLLGTLYSSVKADLDIQETIQIIRGR